MKCPINLSVKLLTINSTEAVELPISEIYQHEELTMINFYINDTLYEIQLQGGK